MTDNTGPSGAWSGDLVIAKQGCLYVGGRYHELSRDGGETGRVMAGQAYVEFQVPAHRRHELPIVMIPGGCQSGTCFTQTPDGRDGWAQYFLREGYAVYVLEQPGRGRSARHPEIQGAVKGGTAEAVSRTFTAPARFGLYPQAERHSQWPGSGEPGDPVFDAFYASQLDNLVDRDVIQHDNQAAGAALLDEIGPAILMTHSQSGTFGWLIADARPNLVKAIVAVEPGCAVGFIEPVGPPDWFEYSGVARTWGLANIPLTYDPPVTDPAELNFVLAEDADAPGLARCWLQAEPARKLANLAGLPVAVVSAEASFHSAYDPNTAKFLAQAGVAAEFIGLADAGIHGNGHMMMLERNSDEIAALIHGWIMENVAGA